MLVTWILKVLLLDWSIIAALAIEWFESKYMKLNQDKCHFLFSGLKYEKLFANVGEANT